MIDWLRLFPDADHRLQMTLRPGDAPRFWQHSEEAEHVLAERRQWLATHRERLLLMLPEAEEAVREAAEACGQLYVNHRWLGGTLTNFRTVYGVKGDIAENVKFDVFGQWSETSLDRLQTNNVTRTPLLSPVMNKRVAAA